MNEEKFKALIRGIIKGTSEQAGCSDGEEEDIEKLIKYCDNHTPDEIENVIISVVAYGGSSELN